LTALIVPGPGLRSVHHVRRSVGGGASSRFVLTATTNGYWGPGDVKQRE
jgi:hypothetical protein